METTSLPFWADDTNCAITVCDADCRIIYMNEKSRLVNARFGDPECQAVLSLLDSDLMDIFLACTNGTLDQADIRWKPGAACCLVLASGGYPASYQSGYPITGLEQAGEKARGAVAASDAFFPFRDGFDVLAEAGVTAVIEPGGSIRDDEVIAAANEHGVALVFTGHRHFRH